MSCKENFFKNTISVSTLISELRKGDKVRITYNKKNYDNCGGWWSEELWEKSITEEIYYCTYTESSYEKDFYSMYTEKEAESFFKEAIRDFIAHQYGEQSVLSIKIEPDEDYFLDNLEEKYFNQMKKLKDESDHDEADWILCDLLKELGYTRLVEKYLSLPKWYS